MMKKGFVIDSFSESYEEREVNQLLALFFVTLLHSTLFNFLNFAVLNYNHGFSLPRTLPNFKR